MIHPDDRGRILAEVERCCRDGKSMEAEYRMVTRDGRAVWFRDHARMVADESGEPMFVQGILLDIGVRKKAEEDLRRSEERLRQVQKMEAVGMMAGGIAHDFNNLLLVVKGYSQMILKGLRPSDPLYSKIHQINDASDRAAALSHELLSLTRRQELKPEMLNMNSMLRELEPFFVHLTGEKIRVVVHPAPDLWPVLADHGKIEQVLLNLVTNARDAMPEGGALTLTTSNVALSARQPLAAGDYVRVAVADTGVGMDSEVLKRIFEPFFSTKRAGKGTGLGLAIVFDIVMQAGGAVSVNSRPGQGAKFIIDLPRARTEG
jgi:two-component system, cell cycle sensor histidine kinase and response regulator CckA